MDIGQVIALFVGLGGLAGVIFTALRFRADSDSTIVNTQSSVLRDMVSLNSELRQTAADLREERDKLRIELWNLSQEVDRLRDGR